MNTKFIMLINVKNANNCWHVNVYLQDKYTCESIKASKIFIFQYFSFYEHLAENEKNITSGSGLSRTRVTRYKPVIHVFLFVAQKQRTIPSHLITFILLKGFQMIFASHKAYFEIHA